MKTEDGDSETAGTAGDEDGQSGGRGGSSGAARGGVGAVDSTGGVVSTGGRTPTGGTVSVGGTVPAGGATPAGGIGGTVPMGGVMATGGIGGMVPAGGAMPTGGSAGAGATGGVNVDTECRGISANMPCTLEGKHCPNLACGLARSGRRECNCDTNWQCTSCDFTNSPFRDRPANIPPCMNGVADEAVCEQHQENTVCGPIANGDYCACYANPLDGLIWDCNTPPSTWP